MDKTSKRPAERSTGPESPHDRRRAGIPGAHRLRAILHEVCEALGNLRRSPAFTCMAVTILGLGLGVTLYMFTYVKSYMLTPLPYPDGRRIMHIERADPRFGTDGMEVTQHEFVDWQAEQTSFTALAAFHAHPVILADDEPPGRLDGAYITPSAFDVTQVDAHVGRTLVPSDARPGAPAVVVLGYDVWLNRYNGDPAIIGEVVRVNGEPVTVVGVMPPGFRFPVNDDVWLPLTIDLARLERGEGFTVQVFGRLEPGVTLAQARGEFANMAAALAAKHGQDGNLTVDIKPYQREFVPNDVRLVVGAMFVAVLFVLLIACANVANLILARTVARQKDLAVRTALGADRWRILVHVLTESIVLATAGAVVAYWLARAGLDITTRAIVAADKAGPFWIDLSIDWRVLAFGVLAAMVAGLLAGIMPAMRATRVNVNEHLKEGAKGSGVSASKLSRALVTAEIALSCVLLVCSGLMIRSVVNLNAQPLGIQSSNVLTGRVWVPGRRDESVVRFYEELVQRLEAHPEALVVTAGSSYPGIDSTVLSYQTRGMEVPESGRLPTTNYAVVMSNYADALGIELVGGRWFDSRDRSDTEPVVVIDHSLAQEAFPDADALGRQIRIGSDDGGAQWRTVVGVTEPLLLDQLDDPRHPAAFVPLSQAARALLTVAVRTRGEPLVFAPVLRDALFEMDPEAAVYWVRTLDNWIWAGNFTAQLVALLFSVFAALAVILAAAGIYGVLAYTVGQRTREIGMRRALGAGDGRILGTILGQGAMHIGVGLVFGTFFALGFAQLLTSRLWGVTAFDPLTLIVVVVTLFIVAMVASAVPTWRALRVNPLQALRHE